MFHQSCVCASLWDDFLCFETIFGESLEPGLASEEDLAVVDIMVPEIVHAAQTNCNKSTLLISHLTRPFAHLANIKCHRMSSNVTVSMRGSRRWIKAS